MKKFLFRAINYYFYKTYGNTVATSEVLACECGQPLMNVVNDNLFWVSFVGQCKKCGNIIRHGEAVGMESDSLIGLISMAHRDRCIDLRNK